MQLTKHSVPATRRSVAAPARRAAAVVRRGIAGDVGGRRSGANDEKQPVRDAPKPSVLDIAGALLNTDPNRIAVDALDGNPFAWKQGTLYIADPPTVDEWMGQEWKRGTVTQWPSTISQLLGAEAMAVSHNAAQHARLREIFGVMLSNAQVDRMLPGIQATTQRYMAEWSKRGTVKGYDEMLVMIFDILVNTTLQLGWSDADIKKYSPIFEEWNQGFTLIANPLPWSKFQKGMRAREVLINKFRSALNGNLVPGSIPAVLRDEYGANSPVITDNLIMVIFAGFETTCGLATGLLWHMARDTAALSKMRDEQAAVASAHGGKLTGECAKDMRYTNAALDEVLRLSQMVAGVPRQATDGLDLPRAPAIPKGCPLSISWGGMSLRDPAVKGSEGEFKPERWLVEANAATKAVYQRPFGWGTHDCVGRRVARSIALAVAQEVSLRYKMTAEATDEWSRFPTGGRMKNGLPLTLTRL